MKSLFGKYDRYSQDASELVAEVNQYIRPILVKYIDMGYSPREISHIIQAAISVAESDIVLSRALIANKTEYRNKKVGE